MGTEPNRYAALLRVRGVGALLAAGALARLPLGMYGVAILLAVQRGTGSLTAAGLVAGTAAAAGAVAGPAQARMIDRYGRPRPLAACAALNLAAFAALIAGLTMDAGTAVLAGTAALTGATVPAVAVSQRAIWRGILPAPLAGTAMAVDSMQLDAYLIAGPLLVGVLSPASPLLPLGVSAVLIATGTLWFAALPHVRAGTPGSGKAGTPGSVNAGAPGSGNAVRPGPGGAGGPRGSRGAPRNGMRRGALGSAGVRTVVATIALTGVGLGAMRVGLAGFTASRGDTAAVTWLLTAFGTGSLLGGVWAGARTWRMSTPRRYLRLLCGFGGGLALLLAGTALPPMLVLAAVAGFALTPVTVCEFLLLQESAPESARTEAFAWGTTATFAGAALGSALSGFVVEEAGWRAAILGAACLPPLAAALLAARRRTIMPEAPGPGPDRDRKRAAAPQ